MRKQLAESEDPVSITTLNSALVVWIYSLLQLFLSANLLNQQRHPHHVEILIQLLDLLEVLLLHFPPGIALIALAPLFGVQQLVDDNGVRVDVVAREFLDHTLGFIEGEKLGDADAYEGG